MDTDLAVVFGREGPAELKKLGITAKNTTIMTPTKVELNASTSSIGDTGNGTPPPFIEQNAQRRHEHPLVTCRIIEPTLHGGRYARPVQYTHPAYARARGRLAEVRHVGSIPLLPLPPIITYTILNGLIRPYASTRPSSALNAYQCPKFAR